MESPSDVRLDLMQVQVHQGQTSRAGNEILTVVGFGPETLCHVPIQRSPCLLEQPLVSRHEEATRTTGGIANLEVLTGARIRLHATDHGPDEDARREVLAGALLPLGGRLLQKPLENGALHVDVEARPLGLVDKTEELLQVNGVGEAALRAAEDVA
jgi:hypothetical protein